MFVPWPMELHGTPLLDEFMAKPTGHGPRDFVPSKPELEQRTHHRKPHDCRGGDFWGLPPKVHSNFSKLENSQQIIKYYKSLTLIFWLPWAAANSIRPT